MLNTDGLSKADLLKLLDLLELLELLKENAKQREAFKKEWLELMDSGDDQAVSACISKWRELLK